MAQGHSGDGSKLCFVFITWVYCVLSLGVHLLECRLCTFPWWARWQVGTKCNESLRNITWHPQTKTKDYGTTTKIQTRTQITNVPTTPVTIGQGFWLWSHQVMTSHLVNCHPLLSRKVSRRWPEPSKTLKGWGTDLSWWSALGNCKTTWFVDRPVRVSIHKALNSSHGVIHCHGLSGMTEMEIRTELQEQGVVEVHRVTVKKDTEKVPTNTLFLTFNTPDLPKEITVGYLKVKVALFVPNPMRCFNCSKFGHMSQHCKVAAKCTGCGKDKHEGQCEGPKLCSNCNGPHASLAKDCLVWQKDKEVQRVRVEKHISFPEARQLVEAKVPNVITGGKTYATATSTRRESISVQCQTLLTWVFSECPLRMTESNVCSSGGPGSLSTGTQASSGKSGTVSANAWVPCESTKCSSEMDRGSANPPKTASRGSANPHKMASKGSAAPFKSAPEGSAGPLKTMASKDDSSSSRCSPTKVRVDGVLVDVEGFSHPRRSTPSSRLQVPPKPKVPDRQSKAERKLVLSNQYSALSDDKMESS